MGLPIANFRLPIWRSGNRINWQLAIDNRQ
jgi:hypothetical protein